MLVRVETLNVSFPFQKAFEFLIKLHGKRNFQFWKSLLSCLCCLVSKHVPSDLNPVLLCLRVGMGSFLLYSVHEGIRGIPLDPLDKSDALVPVSGTSLAVGIDFHAGECECLIYS